MTDPTQESVATSALEGFVGVRWKEDKARLAHLVYLDERLARVDELLAFYDQPQLHAVIPSLSTEIVARLREIQVNRGMLAQVA